MKKADKFFSNTLSWCYHVLFFVTPLLFTWFNEELFEFNKMLFVYAMSLIIGGLWLAQMAMQRKFTWKKTLFDLPIGLFILSQLLSTLFSIHPWTSVFGYYTRFNGGLLSTFAYVTLLAVFIQTISARRVWDYFKTLAIASLLVSAVAIPEHFGHSLSCVFINSSHLSGSLPASEVFSPAQLWESYNAQCWIQDVQSRVFATFGQPNWLAAYAVILLPVFTILASIRKGKEQWLYVIASLGLLLDLIFSKSRSGLGGLAVGAAWFTVLAAIWLRRTQLSSKKSLRELLEPVQKVFKNSALIVVAAVLFIEIFGTAYNKPLQGLLWGASTPEPAPLANRLDEGGTSSGEIRKIVWTGALDVWKRYPILGSGVETFAYSYYKDRPMAHNLVSEWDFLYNKAHNEFLNYLATTGIVGLVSYCIMLGFFIGYPAFMALKNSKNSLEMTALLLSISAGLVALTVSNALGFSTVTVCVLMYLFVGMAWKLQQDPPAVTKAPVTTLPKKRSFPSEDDEEFNMFEWVWPGVVGLIVLIGLLLVWRTWRADYLYARGKQLTQSQQYADGLEALESAYQIGGNEGIFAEELGETYSWLSAAFAESNQATSAALYRQAAEEKTEEMLRDNPYNLNFYKTKTRILATLAPQDPELLKEAEDTLVKATELAPTDPKVRLNLGLIRMSQGNIDQAVKDLEQTVKMKPNYEDARMSLAKLYLELNQPQKALEQYRYILDKIQPANVIAQTTAAAIEAQLATASASPKPKTAPSKK